MKQSHLTDQPESNGTSARAVRDPLTAMLLPSIVAILVSLALLCGTTWAWYSSSQTVGTVEVKSAEYKVSVVVAKDGSTLSADADGNYTLEAGKTYAVTLTAGGTAKTGFVRMQLTPTGGSGKELYSCQIKPEDSVTFSVTLTNGGTVAFCPVWGTSSRAETPDIGNDSGVTE